MAVFAERCLSRLFIMVYNINILLQELLSLAELAKDCCGCGCCCAGLDEPVHVKAKQVIEEYKEALPNLV